MKKFLKQAIGLFLTFLFIFLLFRYSTIFKKCILNGCTLFMEQVFPFLFPMFLANDFLMNYQIDFFLFKTIHKIFKPLFHFSSLATSIFVLSMFSGTPTNAYLVRNLVKENKLTPKDASVIISYSCFLNPLFLYSILMSIFHNPQIVLKLFCIEYGINFFMAFLCRRYPYQNTTPKKEVSFPFSTLLTKSLKKSLDTLLMILGIILFYLLLTECLNFFFPNAFLNCLLNGLLETTGGLLKLNTLNCNLQLKQVLASLFISFTGLSIYTQIKNILSDASISAKPFLKGRIFHALLSTSICIIMS